MNRKLTITVSEAVYEGLHRTIGRRRISQFIEKLARPHVVPLDIEASYRDMAADRMRDKFGESAVSLAAGLRGSFRERTHENPASLPGKKKP